jgi:plastocyanin
VLIQTGRVGWTTFALLAGLLAAGCGQQQAPSSSSPATNPSPLRGTPATVVIKNLAFAPTAITLPVGGLVTWNFEDGGVPHTVTADDNSFGSPPNGLTSGSFQHTFGQAGTFAYHCDFHPQMKATVTVR